MAFRNVLSLAVCIITLGMSSVVSAGDPELGFQLHTGPDGRIYRIDTRTGKTNLLENGSFSEVSETGMPQLVVGKVYRSEDGKSTFRYIGSGKLEPWGLDKIFK